MTGPETVQPVTVIGGYLGAGKTTLINHLLRNANGVRLAILVNDFGELAIDEDLIEAEDDDIISITGGCVCCSFGNDLGEALMALAAISPRPDHVVIEASGVAIPSAIVGSVSLLRGFRNDGVIILADAETITKSARDKYMGDTVQRQITDGNIVLLNKVDLVSTDQRSQAKAWITGQNPTARIVETVSSVVATDIVLDSFMTNVGTPQTHYEPSGLTRLVLRPQGPLDLQQLAQLLASEPGIIRAKGFAYGPDGTVGLIQVVGSRCETQIVSIPREPGIVCLGFEDCLDTRRIEHIATTCTL